MINMSREIDEVINTEAVDLVENLNTYDSKLFLDTLKLIPILQLQYYTTDDIGLKEDIATAIQDCYDALSDIKDKTAVNNLERILRLVGYITGIVAKTAVGIAL